MRLDKLLYETGYGGRKQVKRLIRSKQVQVNGQIILSENSNVDPSLQRIIVSGKELNYQPHAYYMLNKPQGVVSAVKDKQHQTVIDLLQEEDKKVGLFPVGRLDRDTEGLVFITDNGQLGHQLLMPHKGVTKKYQAIVNEGVTQEDVVAFQKGIIFHGDIHCQPAKLEILSSSKNKSEVLVEINEGKFHQVKKMFLAVGKKVVFLKRLSIGELILDDSLKNGDYRKLTEAELEKMMKYFN